MSLINGPKNIAAQRRQPPSNPTSLATRYGRQLMQASGLATVRMFESMLGVRLDPAPAYLFYIELGGVIVGLFTECSGLEVERDVETYAEGGRNNFEHKLPGRVTFSNITLKRGLSLSRELWDWFSLGMYDFKVRRINFSIIQGAPGHNLAGIIAGAAMGTGGIASTPWESAGGTVFQAIGRGFGKIKHWNVEDAYPVKWTGPSLSTSSKTTAIEAIEIAHHGLTLSAEVGTPMSVAASVAGAVISGVETGMGALQEAAKITGEGTEG